MILFIDFRFYTNLGAKVVKKNEITKYLVKKMIKPRLNTDEIPSNNLSQQVDFFCGSSDGSIKPAKIFPAFRFL